MVTHRHQKTGFLSASTPAAEISVCAGMNCVVQYPSMQVFKFHPVTAKWFEEKFGSPTEPQKGGWPAIQAGSHVLIAAPTGSGKTLAAFFAELDLLFREGLKSKL